MKIVSVGCVCVDVFVDADQILPGGESLNFCGSICKFPDVDCSLAGVIGDDLYGSTILECLKKYPINTQLLTVKSGSTANHRINHTKDGDRYFKEDSWDGGVYDDYVLEDFVMERICLADAVHTTVDSPVFRQVIDCKKKADFLLAVDFNEYRNFGVWEEFLPYVDLFFISGNETLFDELRALSAKYKAVFICTLAENGSIAFADRREYRCSAIRVESVVDTTGAGDSFQAGFVREFYAGRNIGDSLAAGSKCAAENICRLGGF